MAGQGGWPETKIHREPPQWPFPQAAPSPVFPRCLWGPPLSQVLPRRFRARDVRLSRVRSCRTTQSHSFSVPSFLMPGGGDDRGADIARPRYFVQ